MNASIYLSTSTPHSLHTGCGKSQWYEKEMADSLPAEKPIAKHGPRKASTLSRNFQEVQTIRWRLHPPFTHLFCDTQRPITIPADFALY